MISNDSAMDKLAMVSRLLAYQQDQGTSTETALIHLRESLPDKYSNTIIALEKMTEGEDEVLLTGYGTGPFEIYTRLARLIRDEKGDVAKLFTATQSSLRDAMVQAREYWSGFNALIGYMTVVTFLAAITITIYTIYVLPQFSEMFDAYGEQLPTLTRVVLDRGIIFNAIVLGLALIVISSIFFSYHIRKKVAQFLPLNRQIYKIPGLGNLSQVYSYYLFIQYAGVLNKAGLSPKISLHHAQSIALSSIKLSNVYTDWREALNSAAGIHALEQEIYYQSEQIGSLFNRQMIAVRERLTLGVQVALGLVIGTLVIAMYLPIFKMGSIA